mgnify:CR=1 FL=1
MGNGEGAIGSSDKICVGGIPGQLFPLVPLLPGGRICQPLTAAGIVKGVGPGTTFGDFSDFAHYDEEIDRLITLIEVGNGEGLVWVRSW